MKVLAPGKLILSGEHAVVYGKPALAMAVNRYAAATATAQVLPFIFFDLSNLDYKHRLSLFKLKRLKNRIKEKYQHFVKGECHIRHVLQKPVELAQFAFTLFFDTLNIALTRGMKIHVASDIPMGCGMGSSAATIVSMIYAVAEHLHIDISPDIFFRLSLEAENMQHGVSSGLDLRVSLQGGCLYLKEGQIYHRNVPHLSMYLVNTGTPESSTGDCVVGVAHHFKNTSIGDDFAAVTEGMDRAIKACQWDEVKRSVFKNHELLTTIGVVPQKIQNFIRDIRKIGGAGKICGAGSLRGDKAGVALVITEDEAALKKVCMQYAFPILPISGESRGVHVV